MRIQEGDSFENEYFDERVYLTVNPDVAEAVRKGQLESGIAHYQQFGRKEGRVANARHFILCQARQHSLLKEAIAERDGQIAFLTQAVSERDCVIKAYSGNNQIQQLAA